MEVRANLNLSAVNYVGYTYDNRVVDLRTPYLPLTFILPSICFFPAIFLETTSLLFRYHSVITVSPSNTFPVPCHLSSAQLPNILHLQRSSLPTTGAQRRSTAKRTTTCHPPLVLCSAITRRVKNRTKMRFFLQMRKFCCTFAVAIRAIGLQT